MIAIHSFVKRFYAIFFCFHVIFCRLDPDCEFIRSECGFSINSKISLVSSSNNLILIMKISVTNFDILQILILKLYFEAIIVSSGLLSVELSIMYFKAILKLQNLFSLSFALDYFFGPASARSYKIGVVGNNWLVGWLVTLFSQKRL